MIALYGWLDEYARAVGVVLQIACGSVLLGFVWGILGAIAKLSNSRILRFLGDAYTTVIRGIPELVLVLIVYFGSTVLLTKIASQWNPDTGYVDVPAMAAGIFALSLVFGAYSSEVLRGAILAVSKGDAEAARAIGMTSFQVFRYVTFPAMWRHALPGLGNHWLSLIKDTSLISVVGLEDIMRVANMGTAIEHKPFVFYSFAILIYLILTAASSYVLTSMESRANVGIRRNEV